MGPKSLFACSLRPSRCSGASSGTRCVSAPKLSFKTEAIADVVVEVVVVGERLRGAGRQRRLMAGGRWLMADG